MSKRVSERRDEGSGEARAKTGCGKETGGVRGDAGGKSRWRSRWEWEACRAGEGVYSLFRVGVDEQGERSKAVEVG